MYNKDPETMSNAELMGEEAHAAMKEVLPKISSGAQMSWKLFLGLLVAAIVFVAIGLATGNNKITALGNVFKIIALGGVAFVFGAFLYPFLGGKYLRVVAVCVSTQFAITAVMVFFKEMPMTLTAYTLLNLGSATLCLALWAASPPLQFTSGIIILLSIVTMLFPEPVRRFERSIVGLNVTEPAQFARGSISSGKKPFFGGKNGKESLYFYSFEKGKYVLFEVDGYDSLSGDKLMPVTRELAFRLRENENLISPRNFIGETTSSTPASTGSYSASQAPAVPEPPPAPAPYVPSPPETSSRINLSKPWKYRYEVIPGYQRYKERAFSGWAPARIERWDSEVKIVTLAPDGREIGDFNGTRTGPDTYRGSWSTRDGSGRGEFYCRRENPDQITGSMNDVTVDQRFLPMELSARHDAKVENPTRDQRRAFRPRYDASRNSRRKREVARVPQPAPSQPRRAVEPRPAPAFSSEPESGYKKAAIERQPAEPTVQPTPPPSARPGPQFRPAHPVSAVPRPKPTATAKPAPVESELEFDSGPMPKKSKKEEEDYRRLDRMAWPNSQ